MLQEPFRRTRHDFNSVNEIIYLNKSLNTIKKNILVFLENTSPGIKSLR